MNKPKLLYVIADSSRTGAPTQVLYLARGLKSQFDLGVICPSGWLSDELTALRIKVYHLPQHRSARQTIGTISRIYQQVQPDLIHCHGVRGGIVGRLARIPRGSKVVYTEHLWTRDFHLHNKGREFVQLMMLRALRRRTDFVVAVSQAVHSFLLRDHLAKRGSSQVIYGAIEPLPQFKSKSAERIGTLGWLTEVKGVDTLIQALPQIKQKVPQVQCVIGGSGPEKASLMQLAKELKVNQLIEWVDKVDQLAKFMCRLKVYVQPSRSEAFGLAPLEAASVGVPVVVADAGALPELFAKSGLVFAQKNPADLAKKVVKVLTNSALNKELAQKGQELAARFSLSVMVSQHEVLYRQLIG